MSIMTALLTGRLIKGTALLRQSLVGDSHTSTGQPDASLPTLIYVLFSEHCYWLIRSCERVAEPKQVCSRTFQLYSTPSSHACRPVIYSVMSFFFIFFNGLSGTAARYKFFATAATILVRRIIICDEEKTKENRYGGYFKYGWQTSSIRRKLNLLSFYHTTFTLNGYFLLSLRTTGDLVWHLNDVWSHNFREVSSFHY